MQQRARGPKPYANNHSVNGRGPALAPVEEHEDQAMPDDMVIPGPSHAPARPQDEPVYDLEMVLPGPTFQGDVVGLDYVDNATADRLYAYAVVAVLSARLGSAASQSFFRTQAGQAATKPTGAQSRRGKSQGGMLAVEDQDTVEYLDRYLFKEYASTRMPVELNPFILFSNPVDIEGLRLADALITRSAPPRLRSVAGTRRLAHRWRELHPDLWQANQRHERYYRPLTMPILWIAALAGMGTVLMAALLAVTGNILVSSALAAAGAVFPGFLAFRAFRYLMWGLPARRRLTQAVLNAIQAELDAGFPQATTDVSLYPGFAAKLNLTRSHPLFRAILGSEDFLATEVSNPRIHQVLAVGRRMLNRLAGRGAATNGLIMLVSTDANLNTIVPQVVADTIKSVPQYHYSDPTYRSSVFGIIMRPWEPTDLPFISKYYEAAARCSEARWARRNPLPEQGDLPKPAMEGGVGRKVRGA